MSSGEGTWQGLYLSSHCACQATGGRGRLHGLRVLTFLTPTWGLGHRGLTPAMRPLASRTVAAALSTAPRVRSTPRLIPAKKAGCAERGGLGGPRAQSLV